MTLHTSHATRHGRRALTAAALIAAALVATTAPSQAAAACTTPSWDFDADGVPDNVIGNTPTVQVHQSSFVSRYRGVAPPDTNAPSSFGASVASISAFEAAGDDAYCALLVVGAPDTTVNSQVKAGAVYVYSFEEVTSTGRQPKLVHTLTQGSDGIPGSPQANARFGASVAAAEHEAGYAKPTTLSIGAPGQTVNGAAGAGSVTTMTVPIDGPVQDTRVVTTGKAGAALGTALAATDELIVAGAPGTTVSGKTKAGSVLLVPQNPATAVREVTEDTSGVPGGAETSDGLGKAIAVHWNADLNRTEIGWGLPLEDVGSVVNAGSVVTMRATATGALSSLTSFTQNSSGVQGSAEQGDMFGTSISAKPRSSGASAWYVGVPLENVGSVIDAGQVQTVGLSTNSQWDRSTAGVPGTIGAGQRMGKCLSSVVDGVGPVIGVPANGSMAGAAFSGLPIDGHTVWEYDGFEEADTFGCAVGA